MCNAWSSIGVSWSLYGKVNVTNMLNTGVHLFVIPVTNVYDSVNIVVPAEAEDMEESLYQWVSKERFVAFPKVSGVGLNEMASLGKLLAIFVLDDKDSEKVEQSG